MSTGKFGALCLEKLSPHVNFTRIITGLPTRSGRNSKENISEVESAAIKLNLGGRVTRTGRLTENNELKNSVMPDLIFVIDFGQIIKEPFLNAPKFGCMNIHPSLLPEFRGAAPIQRALMSGKNITGVSVFKLVKTMDAGEIYDQAEIKIDPDDSAESLYEKSAALGCEMAVKVLNSLPNIKTSPQNDDKATYADKILKSEHELNFAMTAENFCNHVRALNMSGGAYVILKNNKRLKIWRARIHDDDGEQGKLIKICDNNPVIACSSKSIELVEIQPEGKKKITGQEWLNGARIKTGCII